MNSDNVININTINTMKSDNIINTSNHVCSRYESSLMRIWYPFFFAESVVQSTAYSMQAIFYQVSCVSRHGGTFALACLLLDIGKAFNQEIICRDL